jgi:hypothetical protein
MSRTGVHGADTINVFLSHDSADAESARRIRSLISRFVNARVFMDEDLRVGENWKSRLRSEIRKADIVVALLTPAALYSSWVLQEVGGAWALEKPILPIVTRRDLLNRFSIALRPDLAVEVAELDDPSKAGDRLSSVFERAFEGVPKA